MSRLPLRTRDVLALGGYCVLFAIVAPAVALLALRAWVSDGVVTTIAHTLAGPFGGIGSLAAGLFGAYLGLLALMWFDDMKRYTALILTVATGASLLLFDALDVFFRYITPENLGALVVGGGLAFVLAGGLRLTSSSSVQFPRASGGLFAVVTGLTVVSYLQVYVAETPGGLGTSVFTEQLPLSAVWAGTTTPLVDSATALAFVAATFGLVTYEARENFLVLGPPRSGKTTLQTGFYHVVEEMDTGQTKPNPSKPLADKYRRFLAADGWGPLDDPTPNLEFNRLRFRYQIGRLFPRFQRIEAYDTAGEHTGRQLVESVQRLAPRRLVSVATLLYIRHMLARPFISRPEQGSVESNEAMADLLAREMLFSDTVVFVIDAASLVENCLKDVEQAPPAEYFGTYQQILTTLNECYLPEKDVHLVVTKADNLRGLYEQYTANSVGLRHSDRYESFRQFVEYLLRDRDDVFPTTNDLFRMAPDATVSVVHYEMDQNADDDPVPADPVRVHGFAETLEAMTHD